MAEALEACGAAAAGDRSPKEAPILRPHAAARGPGFPPRSRHVLMSTLLTFKTQLHMTEIDLRWRVWDFFVAFQPRPPDCNRHWIKGSVRAVRGHTGHSVGTCAPGYAFEAPQRACAFQQSTFTQTHEIAIVIVDVKPLTT